MNTMTCGCKTNGFMIVHCPLHKAAPELLAILKEMFGQMPKHKNPELAQRVARALAQAEGK